MAIKCKYAEQNVIFNCENSDCPCLTCQEEYCLQSGCARIWWAHMPFLHEDACARCLAASRFYLNAAHQCALDRQRK